MSLWKKAKDSSRSSISWRQRVHNTFSPSSGQPGSSDAPTASSSLPAQQGNHKLVPVAQSSHQHYLPLPKETVQSHDPTPHRADSDQGTSRVHTSTTTPTPNSYVAANLCDACNRVGDWLHSQAQTGAWLNPPSQWKPTGDNVYEMGRNASFESEYCHFCSFVLKTLSECFAQSSNTSLNDTLKKLSLDFGPVILGSKAKWDVGPRFSIGAWSPIPFSDTDEITRVPGMKHAPIIRVAADMSRQHQEPINYSLFGRRLTDGTCDIALFQSIYRDCLNLHGSICETTKDEVIDLTGANQHIAPGLGMLDLDSFYLVDVQESCVVRAQPHWRYFALSYVWGPDLFLRSTRANFKQLQSPGSLNSNEVPRTIRDAIDLTRLLGERYLWVDCLCIIQDDEESKLLNISQMDTTYLKAALTIIAASGEDVHAGLTGLSPGSRTYNQPAVSFGGFQFVSVGPPMLKELRELPWCKRVWTYQEFMLSKRVLIFTERRAFFQCELENLCEDSFIWKPQPVQHTGPVQATSEHPLWKIEARHQVNHGREFRFQQNFHTYIALTKDISLRNLTMAADIIDALTGVLKAMSGISRETYLCGLPASMLEWALTWQPNGPMKPRSVSDTGHPFPSWSWIGWIGRVMYPLGPGPIFVEPVTKRWLYFTPEALELSKQGKSDKLRHLSPPRVARDNEEVNWTLTSWAHLFFVPPTEPTRGFRPRRKRTTNEIVYFPTTLQETGYLHFPASKAKFYIETTASPYNYEEFDSSLTASYRIIGIRDMWCGNLHFAREDMLRYAATSGDRIEADFIVICKTHWSYDDTNSVNAGLNVGQNTFDNVIFEPLNLPKRVGLLYNVLWVEWRNNIAYRVGAGQIHIQAWNFAALKRDPVEEIVLG